MMQGVPAPERRRRTVVFGALAVSLNRADTPPLLEAAGDLAILAAP